MAKQFFVYLMTNQRNTVIYTGVSSKLVYYEIYPTADEAIRREKQIKGGSRKKKIDLINKINREWRNLSG